MDDGYSSPAEYSPAMQGSNRRSPEVGSLQFLAGLPLSAAQTLPSPQPYRMAPVAVSSPHSAGSTGSFGKRGDPPVYSHTLTPMAPTHSPASLVSPESGSSRRLGNVGNTSTYLKSPHQPGAQPYSSPYAASLNSSHREAQYSFHDATRSTWKANELERYKIELGRSKEYSDLCERRILDMMPDHPLPVTEACLGLPLSSAALAKAGRPLPSGSAPGTPSYILAAEAKTRKDKSESSAAYDALHKSHQAVEAKLEAAEEKINDYRSRLEKSEKRNSNCQRRNNSLLKKINELEAELQKRSRSRSRGRESPSKEVTRLHRKIADLEGALEDAENETKDKTQEIKDLQGKLKESASYIQVLERIRDSKAAEYGIADHADWLTQIARLRGEVEGKSSEIAQLEQDLEVLRHQAAAPPTTPGVQPWNTGAPPSDAPPTWAQEKSALIDYAQEMKDETVKLQKTVEALQEEVRSANAATLEVKEEVVRHRRAAEAAEDRAGGFQEELQDTQRALKELEEHCKGLDRELAAAKQELKEKQSELNELTEVQNELLSAAKLEKDEAGSAKQTVAELRRELEDTKRTLRTTELGLQKCEEQYDALLKEKGELEEGSRQHADELENELLRYKDECSQLEHDLVSTRRQLEEALTTAAEAQDALRTTESKATDGHNRVAELEQEITSLQADIDRLRRELEQTRTQAVSLETAEEEAKALERHERDVELDEERNLAAAGVRRYDTGIPDGRSLRGRRGGDRFLPTEANISLEEVNAEAAGEMDGRGLDMEASGFNFTVSLEGGRGGGGAAEGGGPAGAAAALATTSLARAERALQWATSPQLTESAPTVAKAALRLVNWLQACAAGLEDSSRRINSERREKATQRRLLHDEIHSLRRQIDQLTADLEEARGQHTDAESHWHASHRSQESTINELKRQLEEATSRLQQAEGQLEDLTGQSEATQQEHAAATRRIGELERKLEHGEQAMGELREELEAKQSELSRTRSAMRETATKLTDAQQEVESLRYELERLRETSNESASSIAVERRLLVDRVASLEDQLAAAEERLVETREGSNGLNEALAAKTEEAEGLARNVEELKAQLETVQGELNQLRRQSTATEAELRRDLEDAADLAERQNALVKELEDSNQRLEAGKESLQRALGDMTVDVDQGIHAIHSALQRLSADIQARYDALEGDSAGQERLQQLLHAVWRLLDALGLPPVQPRRTETSASSEALVEAPRRDRRQGLTETLRHASSAMQEAMAAVCGGLLKENDQVALLWDEILRLKDELSSARPRLQALDEAHASSLGRGEALVRAEAKATELRGELAASKSQQKVLQSEVDTLRATVVNVQGELERANGNVAALAQDVENARDAARRAETDYSMAKRQCEELEEEVAQLRHAMTSAAAHRLKAEAATDRESERLTALMREVESLRLAKKRLEANVNDLRNALVDTRQELTNEKSNVTQLTQRMAEQKSRATAKEAEVAELRSRLQEAAEEQAELERAVAADLNMLTAENQEVIRKRNELLSKLAVAQADAAEAKAALKESRDKCEAVQARFASLRQRLEEAERSRDALQQRLAELSQGDNGGAEDPGQGSGPGWSRPQAANAGQLESKLVEMARENARLRTQLSYQAAAAARESRAEASKASEGKGFQGTAPSVVERGNDGVGGRGGNSAPMPAATAYTSTRPPAVPRAHAAGPAARDPPRTPPRNSSSSRPSTSEITPSEAMASGPVSLERWLSRAGDVDLAMKSPPSAKRSGRRSDSSPLRSQPQHRGVVEERQVSDSGLRPRALSPPRAGSAHRALGQQQQPGSRASSPGAARLQERLANVHAVFASMRGRR